MILGITKKKLYIKPSIQIEEVDYCISMQSVSPWGDPTVMKKPSNSNPKKDTSPFGGSKPNYK